MSKKLEIKMSNFLYEKSSEQIRTKDDLIILLLETMKAFILGDILAEDESKGKVILKVDKMSRIFYELDEKYFSFNFPFTLELTDSEWRIYDSTIGIDIDSKIISLLIRWFYNSNSNWNSFEIFFDDLIDYTDQNDYPDINSFWQLINKLYSIEPGYIRYDYDTKYENGDLHPLNHFDINYSSNNAYKLGLKKEIDINDFIDVLDVQTNCCFVN